MWSALDPVKVFPTTPTMKTIVPKIKIAILISVFADAHCNMLVVVDSFSEPRGKYVNKRFGCSEKRQPHYYGCYENNQRFVDLWSRMSVGIVVIGISR